MRQGPWKLHLAKGELYHLVDDIGEAKNIAPAHPDIVQQLRAVADSADSDLGLTGLTGVGPGCRALGRVKNPQPLIARDGQVRLGVE